MKRDRPTYDELEQALIVRDRELAAQRAQLDAAHETIKQLTTLDLQNYSHVFGMTVREVREMKQALQTAVQEREHAIKINQQVVMESLEFQRQLAASQRQCWEVERNARVYKAGFDLACLHNAAYLTCLPGCNQNGSGHLSECEVANPDKAFTRLQTLLAASQRRAGRYREALRWYGDMNNYQKDRHGIVTFSEAVVVDAGQKARQVLVELSDADGVG